MTSISGLSRGTVKHTYYDILEISPDATNQQVKDAYKRLAILKHPDKNLGDTLGACAAFQQVTLAPLWVIFWQTKIERRKEKEKEKKLNASAWHSSKRHTIPSPNLVSARSMTPASFPEPPKQRHHAIDAHHHKHHGGGGQQRRDHSDHHAQHGPRHQNRAARKSHPRKTTSPTDRPGWAQDGMKWPSTTASGKRECTRTTLYPWKIRGKCERWMRPIICWRLSLVIKELWALNSRRKLRGSGDLAN